MEVTKNYNELGGAKTVIGGELEIATGGKITANGVQAAAITSFTDNTGVVTPDKIIENVPATATAPAALADAAARTEVNVALTAIENNTADLTKSVNDILAALRGAGIIA
jgi:glutamate-1-semialdehyde aminotransferase